MDAGKRNIADIFNKGRFLQIRFFREVMYGKKKIGNVFIMT